jgi:peroxiredoxin
MRRVIKIVMLVSILLSGLGVAGCSGGSSSEQTPMPIDSAPEFQLQSLDGQVVALSSFGGKPVMLNFWATWCGPCLGEMPYIQEVFEDEEWREQGLVILAINVGESSSKVGKFMEENGLNFEVLLDADQIVAQRYSIRGIPTTFFIGKDGIIKDAKVGAFSGKAEIDWRLLNSIMQGEQEGS